MLLEIVVLLEAAHEPAEVLPRGLQQQCKERHFGILLPSR